MALSRVTIWSAGQILTAAALNSEFNNILNNPISLISPTTGPINFGSQAHTNFVLENLAADPASATAGRAFFNTVTQQAGVDDGTIIRYMPTLAPGTSGQAVVATSSGTAPVWGVVGPNGLTTGTLQPGAALVYTSNNVFIPVNGSSGQALIWTSSGLAPTAQNQNSGAGTGGLLLLNFAAPSTSITSTAFQTVYSTTIPTGVVTSNKGIRITVLTCADNAGAAGLFIQRMTLGATNLFASSFALPHTVQNAPAESIWHVRAQNSSALQSVTGRIIQSGANPIVATTSAAVDFSSPVTLTLACHWEAAGGNAVINGVLVESL